jgi:hypothetical protein
LEGHHGLIADSAGHIWLLHHLFLNILNEELLEWAEHWNTHTMRLKHEGNKSPRQMFMMGLRECLMDAEDEVGEDPEPFGIDHEALEDGALIDHMMDREDNPFENHVPDRFNEVRCEPPNCPLGPAEMQRLDATLAQEFDMATKSMEIRRIIWDRALGLCRALF